MGGFAFLDAKGQSTNQKKTKNHKNATVNQLNLILLLDQLRPASGDELWW